VEDIVRALGPGGTDRPADSGAVRSPAA
jgi:hypothetical protein